MRALNEFLTEELAVFKELSEVPRPCMALKPLSRDRIHDPVQLEDKPGVGMQRDIFNRNTWRFQFVGYPNLEAFEGPRVT